MGANFPAPLRRRDQVLAFIIEPIVRFGTAPTSVEISRELSISDSRAKELIAQLIKRGVVEKNARSQAQPARARRCRIPGPARGRQAPPWLGYGAPYGHAAATLPRRSAADDPAFPAPSRCRIARDNDDNHDRSGAARPWMVRFEPA
ncbi:hypothetical protein [Sphingomonas sp.]|jgi:hypothetical protein|uniref:hypothetical protein n=1 Tax=Sphingomonas sp. TaxID=28214 RepID=UPI002631B087|nr:hypothetical protein [Sphingomonas sp.]